MLSSMTTLLLWGLMGCGQPLHLQYDHGRAFYTTKMIQADLDRPSAQGGAYALSGDEGIALRQRVIEESTDAETGTAKFAQSFTAQ
ncbi:MAG: hypothetical protein AAFV53_23185 [Myxococcota bacterium]